jgi:hypothetical protein
MAFSNIKGSIPQALGDLQQLTYLNLNDNQIEGSIPETLGGLQQLTILALYGNRIEGSIPETLAGLKQLTYLNLRDMRLTGVVPSLPFKNYTGNCNLQDPTSPSNVFTCPLPPVSPLTCTVCDAYGRPSPLGLRPPAAGQHRATQQPAGSAHMLCTIASVHRMWC